MRRKERGGSGSGYHQEERGKCGKAGDKILRRRRPENEKSGCHAGTGWTGGIAARNTHKDRDSAKEMSYTTPPCKGKVKIV